MPGSRDTVFYLGLACLFTHELDAVPNHEWRGMPFLRELPDDVGMLVFIAGHVPLFAVLIALVASSNPPVRAASRIGISLFLVIHGALHALSVGSPTYEFSSTLSHVLIFGGASFGALYLVLAATRRLAPGRMRGS